MEEPDTMPGAGADDAVPEEGSDAGPSRVDRWRHHTATGGVAAAIALGLQHAVDPRKDTMSVEQEVPDKPLDIDGLEFHFDPGDAGQSFIVVRPPEPQG